MADFSSQPDALPAVPVAAARRHSASTLESEVVSLFDELRVPLLRYLSGFPLGLPDSEDVIQEAFLALFQYLRKGKSHGNVRGWLFRTTHNLALKRSRQSRKSPQSAGSGAALEDLIADPAPGPEDQLVSNHKQRIVQSVVRALPEQNRWCMYLRGEGLTYREIAEVLDISVGSVALYLERSLALIARAAGR